jgi:hypothetical protein
MCQIFGEGQICDWMVHPVIVWYLIKLFGKFCQIYGCLLFSSFVHSFVDLVTDSDDKDMIEFLATRKEQK